MLVTCLGGCLVAVGHHLFYSSLDQTSVPTGRYAIAGRSLSKQQFNLFLGTSFAFLVKVLLCFAISVAYFQIFWKGMRCRKTPPTLSELDWGSSGLENILHLGNLKLAYRHPALVFLALVFW
jgi:hypothetical protein